MRKFAPEILNDTYDTCDMYDTFRNQKLNINSR